MSKLAMMVTILSLFGVASCSANAVSSMESISSELHGPMWAAWRFNLSAGSDLSIYETFNGCDPEFSLPVNGAYLFIRNETNTYFSGTGGGGGVWLVFTGGAEGQAAALRPDLTSAGVRNGICSGETSRWAFAAPNETQLTVAILQNAPIGWWNVTAQWTTGVESTDIQSATADAKRLAQFERGASLSAYSLGGGAGIGAALHQHATTQHVAIGWFVPLGELPPRDQRGVTISECHQNEVACPYDPSPYGDRLLSSIGQTSWDFDVHARAETQDPPSAGYTLFDLPEAYFGR